MAIAEDGSAVWRPAEGLPKQWNRLWAGRPAFTAIDGKGYRHGTIDYHNFRLHAVVWAWFYGEWPVGQIDHIDGNRQNNALVNLRLVSGAENHKNMKLYRTNTSGAVGVSWNKARGCWVAGITHEGVRHNLGGFANLSDAVAARRTAERELGFHPNHGARS